MTLHAYSREPVRPRQSKNRREVVGRLIRTALLIVAAGLLAWAMDHFVWGNRLQQQVEQDLRGLI